MNKVEGILCYKSKFDLSEIQQEWLRLELEDFNFKKLIVKRSNSCTILIETSEESILKCQEKIYNERTELFETIGFNRKYNVSC